jgi:hypothetical protein
MKGDGRAEDDNRPVGRQTWFPGLRGVTGLRDVRGFAMSDSVVRSSRA